MILAANHERDAGAYPSPEGQVLVHTGGFLQRRRDVRRVVVGVHENRPVYLEDVADVADGPEEPSQYVLIGAGPAARKHMAARGPGGRRASRP